MDMWWGNNRWNWHDHGVCEQSGVWPWSKYVYAVNVGAPMFGSKVFVTCTNGTLRERWYNGSTWSWANHGKPFGYAIDTTPVTLKDGKLFVTGQSGNQRVLLELYWNDSNKKWQWVNHGKPPLAPDIADAGVVTNDQSHVVIQDTNQNMHMLYWSGSAWVWKFCGIP